jgi:hypothetical protein
MMFMVGFLVGGVVCFFVLLAIEAVEIETTHYEDK